MSCEPADRAAAEEGIRLAYAAGGLAPPDRIIWCAGPVDIAKRLAAISADELPGANVKAEIFDQVRDKVGTLAEIFWKEVVVAALEFNHHGDNPRRSQRARQVRRREQGRQSRRAQDG